MDETPPQKSPLVPERARGNLVAAVVAALREQIVGGRFAVGEKLPSEARLTEAFSVSRTVIREAIATLRADGLVEPRQGAGVFVLAPAEPEVRPFQVVDVDKISSIIEVLELRTAVEIEAAALAATRRSPAQEDEIYQAEAEVRALAQEGQPTAQADFRFHRAVALAANNPRFVEFLDMMGEASIPRSRLEGTGGQHSSDSYIALISAEHRAIANAIAQASPDDARAAMRHHLSGSQQRYRSLLRGPAQ
ncbi:FadR/GntR family transcriptional regulator [Pseudosulfitobacter pseudonitzschiae]|uniref:FadR/GntR family transcriptional regulator n=1 Tax=Pseudosulfitobacter pseudonitzschiae TaxID=1402135 RepID=UPI001AF597EC|nr:FadR/GntR family transcriptional regulator [Pseudosulfitobacter pseudonitzschiae]MBM1816776.1 FadR family transcriptional regulator [Pseudosulfitobacter pseudonitzschiae]MBM1833587.1 FadR family transcriptional regulator [Pseudosulfitobacter pseudonitzschiae]MBM1838453.1 FadR family transcriptional regulator [Pseudosulfitobacter pseudonitzschiae]MBM1843503.1 FadR family transcriptional regulator [Pseudosulfitobacter pseudonitzschiae]MBM1848369.1 FadR family transcriptional regulator [Pseudo